MDRLWTLETTFFSGIHFEISLLGSRMPIQLIHFSYNTLIRLLG